MKYYHAWLEVDKCFRKLRKNVMKEEAYIFNINDHYDIDFKMIQLFRYALEQGWTDETNVQYFADADED